MKREQEVKKPQASSAASAVELVGNMTREQLEQFVIEVVLRDLERGGPLRRTAKLHVLPRLPSDG